MEFTKRYLFTSNQYRQYSVLYALCVYLSYSMRAWWENEVFDVKYRSLWMQEHLKKT